MKVAVYYNNSDIRIEERPIPRISATEILVKMKACGICGTDVMEWYRIKKAPRVLGHEMTGEIVEVGNRVEGFKKGDRVFVSHHVPCYRCPLCLQGKYSACESLHKGNYDPGGFAEFIRVPEDNVRYGTIVLPDGITYEAGAVIEPLACAIAGQEQLGLKEGQTVLIIGSGISGILHVQLSKTKKTGVIATDINDYRLGKALEFGADTVMNARNYSTDALKRLTDGVLADAVIVCASAPQAVRAALTSVERKGKILFFAAPKEDIPIPSMEFWRNEVTVTFTYGAAPDHLRKAIDIIGAGLIDAARMVTHMIPFSHIQEGFKLVSDARDSLKVVVVPD